MTKFILYLFETGLCLSLLYLAYWLFLRKETYFNFNRVFLVGSILLALTVPLLHLNLVIPLGSSLEDPARELVRFRDYYEELVLLIDADYGTEPGTHFARAEEVPAGPTADEGSRYPSVEQAVSNSIPVSRILLIIYAAGVIYFLARFFYLVIRLYFLAARNRVTRREGFRMVEIGEEISPFSFFRFLYINSDSFNDSDMEKVLEHEKAHIRQRHSMDHLFAHALAVFQWFNPFAWQIRTALKTTHEYIADRQVISGGTEMSDYQSLLLKQVIGYHSVELVNNFNLKPIKKRIAMMSKKRSGIPARLKATLVIPFAIAAFLLFADFTLKGPGNKLLDIRSVGIAELRLSDVDGIWVKQSDDNFSKLVHFDKDRMSFMDGEQVSEYFWKADGDELFISRSKQGGGTPLKFNKDGNDMKIWWNDEQGILYKKAGVDNTMDLVLKELDAKLDLPMISQFRLLERQDLVSKISIGFDRDGKVVYYFNGSSFQPDELSGLIENERNRHSKLDLNKLTVMFHIDRKIPMEVVNAVRMELRKINSLKVADAGYPEGDLTVSPLQYHMVALPRLLPPMDAKILDKKEVEDMGTRIFTIDLKNKDLSTAEIDRTLEKFIRENENSKYVFSLEYGKNTRYEEYLETVDIVFNVVYRFRGELALEKYDVPYSKLGPDIQKQLRKEYPMVLSEAWSGE